MGSRFGLSIKKVGFSRSAQTELVILAWRLMVFECDIILNNISNQFKKNFFENLFRDHKHLSSL